MRKWLALLVVTLSAGIVLPVLANDPIRVGVYRNEPKVFVDSQGNVQGFFVDMRMIPRTVDLRLEQQENLPTIHVDPTQMEQVALNLVINAGHAMPQGGTLTIRTANMSFEEKSCKQHLGLTPGQYVMLQVSDTGHGIPEDLQNRIFEPFFTTKEPGQGTGLGLSVVYGIVKDHHGLITCKSTPGQGTTFRIYLPVVE